MGKFLDTAERYSVRSRRGGRAPLREVCSEPRRERAHDGADCIRDVDLKAACIYIIRGRRGAAGRARGPVTETRRHPLFPSGRACLAPAAACRAHLAARQSVRPAATLRSRAALRRRCTRHCPLGTASPRCPPACSPVKHSSTQQQHTAAHSSSTIKEGVALSARYTRDTSFLQKELLRARVRLRGHSRAERSCLARR